MHPFQGFPNLLATQVEKLRAARDLLPRLMSGEIAV